MKKWFILFIICLDWSLMWIDFTAVNVALAPIANDLHTSLGTLQWVITAYTLCSAALMTVGGRAGDLYGHKRLFILGTLIFVISSALAGFSPNASLLILSRIGQGIGIAMVVPITTALVYLTFDEKQKGIALGFLTGTTGIAMAIGPTVGGILITYLNWRWVFFINLPIGLFAVLMAIPLIKATSEKKKIRLDIAGIITLILGLLTLLVSLNKIAVWGLSLKFYGLFILSLLLLALFVRIETRCPDPLVHITLLKNRALMGVIALRTCTQYIFFVFMFFICLYLQNILGFSAEKSGYLLLASTLVLGALSPFAGQLMNYFSLRMLITISSVLILFSLVFFTLTILSHQLPYLFICLILFGMAYALHFPTTNLAALQTTSADQSALVTGMLFTMAFAGASAGVTLSSSILDKLSQYKLGLLLMHSAASYNAAQQLLIQHAASGVQSMAKLTQQLPTTLGHPASLIAKQAFVFGLNNVLMICMGLAVLALLIGIWTLKGLKVNLANHKMHLPEI